jgi:hypothetical protein
VAHYLASAKGLEGLIRGKCFRSCHCAVTAWLDALADGGRLIIPLTTDTNTRSFNSISGLVREDEAVRVPDDQCWVRGDSWCLATSVPEVQTGA